jgi:Tol biopolymer transport system component/C-terminal processing protease CtpA/Prc
MTDTQQPARPYLRTPAISPDGTLVAFVHAADIWIVPVAGGVAERLTANPSGHGYPRFSPDGTQLAFSSGRTGQGDIYVLPLSGGAVQRVTCHDAYNTVESWSADGQHLFFSSARDQLSSAIYRVGARGGTPIQWISQPHERLNSLAVSPDGARLAFNVSRDHWWRRGPNPYGGAEVWVVGSAPGADDFRKIGDYTGMNRWPLWAPDGHGLYVVSDRDGMENLWFQPLEHGETRQITSFAEGRMLWPAISADGRIVVFERDFGIWRLDLDTGVARPIPISVRPDTKITPVRVQTYTRELSELALAPDGKKVAFVARGEVFADFADKETDKEQRQGPSFRVTNTPFRERDVAWSPDSRRLVYTSDRHGDAEVYCYDFVTHAETRLTESEGPKAAPSFSPDGKWIAYARGDSEIRLIDAESHADGPFVRANFNFSASFAWSPDSKWVVFVARDARSFSNLYVQRTDEDTPRQVTFLANLSADGPLWAPNGRFIIFTTGQYRAESQIARLDLAPAPPLFREAEFEKLFDRPPAADHRPMTTDDQPSTDDEPSTENAEPRPEQADDSKETREPKKQDEEQKPATEESPDSENLKSRNQNPKSVEIIFEGIERRLRFLTPTQMAADASCISHDSRDLIFGGLVAGKYNLWSIPLDEPRADQPPRQLTSGPSGKWAAQFAPDSKSFYFLDAGQIIIRKFPSGDQTQLYISADVVVDFNREKRQVFDEAWRLLRDHFYDPTFRGLDWSAARAQFAPLVAGAQTYGDLLNILHMLVGELRASHLGASPAWSAPVHDGYIGLLFDPVEQAASDRLIVAAVVPDSPAALAGIRPGEELLAVDGATLSAESNLDALLQRTVGRRVLLRIASAPEQSTKDTKNKKSTKDVKEAAKISLVDDESNIQHSKLKTQNSGPEVREVAVRPISADQYADLRYRGWVYANESYVHKVSSGRLGYVHIREMSYAAYQQFLSDLDAEIHSKEGVVVDVRFNGGGHIATFILDVLARRSVLLSVFRDRPPADAGHLAGNRVLNKPTVLVINERSFSNTEMFAEGYRRLGLGKVVGRPTGGAVIWTFSMRLLDGTWFSLPRIKVATPEGEDLEGTGRAVDVDVSLPVGEPARGKDSQLDAAVKTLLAQIDSLPLDA